MIDSVDDLINILDGNKGTAALLGVGVTAVCNWRKYGRLPPHTLPRFEELASKRGHQVNRSLFERVPDRLRRKQRQKR